MRKKKRLDFHVHTTSDLDLDFKIDCFGIGYRLIY